MKWEKDILGFVAKEDWLNVGFNVTRQNDPVDTLFGDEKTDNLFAKWQSIATEYQIPMMAQYHGFDTVAQKTFRIPVDTHNIEKGLIKVKINQSERLRALNQTGVQGDQDIYEYVINDGVRLAEQVFTRSKVAKNEVLSSGKITIKENDLDLEVDYGVPNDQVGLELDFGPDAEKDIPTQLQDIVDAARAKGTILNGIYTASAVIKKLRQNADIQKAVNGAIGAGQLVKNQALLAYLDEEFGITIVKTNDNNYGASATIGSNGRPSITQKRYYPQDKCTFFSTNPAGRLGTGLWGNPPEADAAGFKKVNTEAGVSPYVFITQWMEDDPNELWTKASGLFMPVLYNPGSLFIADVVSTDEGA